jgi:hypothetical protein
MRMQQDLQQRFPDARLTLADSRFSHTVAQVADFIDMPSRGLSLPLGYSRDTVPTKSVASTA